MRERIQCNQCGRFVAWRDVTEGKASEELVTPKWKMDAPEYKVLCPKCNPKLREAAGRIR